MHFTAQCGSFILSGARVIGHRLSIAKLHAEVKAGIGAIVARSSAVSGIVGGAVSLILHYYLALLP
jgi:hypothetical protein